MILGVISDTHDRLPVIKDAFSFFKSRHVDRVIHCGDWKTPDTFSYITTMAHEYQMPILGVLGNNDIDVAGFIEHSNKVGDGATIQEGVFEFTVDDKKCVIYHGHHRPTLNKVMADTTYDVIFLGHTHKPRIENDTPQLIINPGSTAFSIPRSKNFIPSVAVVDTTTLKAELYFID